MENTDHTFVDCWSLLEEALKKLKEQRKIIDFEIIGSQPIQRWKSSFKVHYNSSEGNSCFHLRMPGFGEQRVHGHYIIGISINTCLLEDDLAAYIEEYLPKDRIITEE